MNIAVLSLHTSPSAQPGQGDAGGMNVYVTATVRRLVKAGHRVEVFTADPHFDDAAGRSWSPDGESRVRIHSIPTHASDKDELASEVDRLADAIAAHPAFAGIDLMWAHYWISGLAAVRIRTEHAPIPFAMSFHTIGVVKNRDTGLAFEPQRRLDAEDLIAARADLLVANTDNEAADMRELLGADPNHIRVALPGVDLDTYTPGPMQDARRALGLETADLLVLYVGRMQFIKGTDVAIDAMAELSHLDPALADRTQLVMLGAASGEGDESAFSELAHTTGIAERIRMIPPVPPRELAQWYRAADLVLVPSRSESFGFVAAEAQAAGVPVVATAVGGLPHVVRQGVTGVLVGSTDPGRWANRLEGVLADPGLRARMGEAAAEAAHRFSWEDCVDVVLDAVRAPESAHVR